MAVFIEPCPPSSDLSRRDFGCAIFAALCLSRLPKLPDQNHSTSHSPELEFAKACHKLMEILEERLGVTFLDTEIAVAFRIPDYYARRPDDYTASYDTESNEMVFHPRYRNVDISRLLEDPEAETYPEDLDQNSRPSHRDLNLLREAIAHELGHYCMDVLAEKKFPDSWIAARYRDEQPIGVEDLGLVIIQEGIGECFGAAVTTKRDYFASSSWEREWDAADLRNRSNWTYLAYQGGYSLIKPMLDQYGQAALEYLAVQPLTFDLPSLKAAMKYQEAALRVLQETSR